MADQDVAGRLEAFAEAIEASPHNLMSPRGVAELRERHIPECVAFATQLPRGPSTLADIGSGGGLPGLVIAIVRPDLETTLIESTRKKAAFLAETAQILGVTVEVVAQRVEDLGDPYLGSFDLVTARAVAPLERLIPWAVPLLAPDGELHAIKGERWQEELEDAQEALEASGARVVSTPEDPRSKAPGAPRVVIIAATGAGTGREGA